MAIELLAPAGEPESGYAALHYGADAIYLGLSRFSARAVAVNFSLDELDEIVAYAHSLSEPRRVYVTVNTVIKNSELPDIVRLLGSIAELQVDAVIVQDLGVARIVRKHFPSLRLHGSTQMAIHNLVGAQMLRELGYDRVTLARELTMEEIENISSLSGLEVECFVQGALCYSYSGLCMFSSMTNGRSGNRGRCAYSCREMAKGRGGLCGYPFSLKDMTAASFVSRMKASGIASLKIEGRKKSPLYVATAVNYYRKMLDGKLTQEEARELEA
ncbi:MAG: U32 family peptidase, partial [Planctomycetes bacterium]|nr:U32 family peptidase [Planctomycetota bacterium]